VATIVQSVDVDVPVRVAYAQWTRFEEFPRFMDSVEEVRQIDVTHLHWVAEAGGQREEWDAEITEQVPDERVAWHATGGLPNAGVVTFQRLDESRTRVTVQMHHETHGLVEGVGSALGFDDRAVKGDLERFKDVVEARDGADGDSHVDAPGGTRGSLG
jgi:uncharacterized membrane protein